MFTLDFDAPINFDREIYAPESKEEVKKWIKLLTK